MPYHPLQDLHHRHLRHRRALKAIRNRPPRPGQHLRLPGLEHRRHHQTIRSQCRHAPSPRVCNSVLVLAAWPGSTMAWNGLYGFRLGGEDEDSWHLWHGTNFDHNLEGSEPDELFDPNNHIPDVDTYGKEL